jgi:ABC-type polysaccharide/polyol phosphate transport system ATPase subunit
MAKKIQSKKRTTRTKRAQETPAIAMESVFKRYVLHHEKPTFSEKFFGRTTQESFTALDDITISIPQGQKVAIIGRNGSGKTTLLKIMCGVTHPTKGKVKRHGRVVSLIDVEAGFHPDLNGYENIFLNGLVIGMSRKEIREKMEEIIKFAGIGSFIDAPLFTYSEGMKMRLGFSVAVHAEPDILILDEMIATGDTGFQKKCLARINKFFRENKTIITVSHLMEFIEPNYHRFIWMDGGKVKMDGGKEVVRAYKKSWK